ncbi:MAG: ABC transporter ATP-binding protein [Treponema sp.]|jgi:oligopeptide/dipeptide ABC transporter ATP-binding protein|nr:ABC transporter ATP-binding protein [Treponema sp.]
MNETPVLEVRDLSVQFRTKTAKIPVLRGVSFNVRRQETLGLVGESGCGKSMTAFSIMGLLPEGGEITEGGISFEGGNLIAALKAEPHKIRGRQISMVFQEPMSSLNPLLTIGQQLYEVLYYHLGLKGAENRERALNLLRSVNIGEPPRVYSCYPFRLSGGMRQRVMIAMALACQPRLVIADEPTTALDVTTQAQILDLFMELKESASSSFIFVSHDLGVIAEVADRICVMYAGRVVEECSVQALFDMPLHPYTQALMQARFGGEEKKRYAIPGSVPSPQDAGTGCAFAPRCEKSAERCTLETPPLFEAGGSRVEHGHKARCWRFIL